MFETFFILNAFHYVFPAFCFQASKTVRMWAHPWKLKFNPDPTKQAAEVLFSCKKSSPNHPQIMYNGTIEAKMNDQKYLGLSLDSRLSFKKHINEKIIKGLSSLRYHKNRHNFIDTPSDICLCNQGIADTNHFLFWCPFLLL